MSDITARIVDSPESLTHNETAIVSEQHLPSGRKVVGHLVLTSELMDDAVAYQAALNHHFDRVFKPWLFPDRNPFPEIDLFPRWTTITDRAKRLRDRFTRQPEWA